MNNSCYWLREELPVPSSLTLNIQKYRDSLTLARMNFQGSTNQTDANSCVLPTWQLLLLADSDTCTLLTSTPSPR